MHELTLLFGIADSVGKVVKENDLDHVDAVVVDIGEATAVVPEFMMDGYSVVSDEYDYLRGSELIINRIKAIGTCRNCDNEFDIMKYEGRCPECGSYDKDIISGFDFYIREIRVREN